MPSTLSNLKPRHSYTFEAIGTRWCIETLESLTDSLKQTIARRIEEFDLAYSRFREDSLVTQVAKAPGVFDFPEDAHELVTFYRRLYDATNGGVTPLIGAALAESGYDKHYSFKPQVIHEVPEWDEVMSWHGSRLETYQPVQLDFGAAGKGYLVDILGELIENEGVGEYTIDASGDIRHRGGDAETIGLENPFDQSRVIGAMNLQNASLCASATNRRQWGGGMHHIIDPKQRSPTRSVTATWVAAESTLIADGLATALFFTDAKQLREKWDFQYVRLESDGKITHSHEFMGELFV